MYLRHTTRRKDGKTHTLLAAGALGAPRPQGGAGDGGAARRARCAGSRASAGARAQHHRRRASSAICSRRPSPTASPCRCVWIRCAWSARGSFGDVWLGWRCGGRSSSMSCCERAAARGARGGAVGDDGGDPGDRRGCASRRASCTSPSIGIAARRWTICWACRPSRSTTTGLSRAGPPAAAQAGDRAAPGRARLGELFELDYDLLLYDVTSTYFEGQAERQSARPARLQPRSPAATASRSASRWW